MRVAEAWALLGIEPTGDRRAVKSAYARLLKAIDVESDPAAFIRLREACELALEWGADLPDWERDDGDAEMDWAGEDWEANTNAEGQSGGLPFHFDLNRLDPFAGRYGPETDGRAPSLSAQSPQLRSAAETLERLLFAPESPDPATVEAAGTDLLVASAEASVDEAAGIEQWLLPVLAQSIPRSDAVFAAAERHFGWGDAISMGGWRANPDLYDLVERRTSRRLLDTTLRLPDSAQGRAAAELMKPGRTRLGWFRLGLARNVKLFFKDTLAAHPMIEHDLDAGTLAWWRRYFEGPHLPDTFWWILLFCPLIFTMVASSTRIIGSSPAALGIAFGGFAAVLAAAMLLYAQLRARAAQREQRLGWYGYRMRGAAGLVAAAMLLPAVASMLATGFWTAVAWSLVASSIMAAGLFAAPSPPRRDAAGSHLVPVGFPAAGVAACGTVGFAVPLGAADHLAIPFLTLCFLVHRTHGLFEVGMADLPRRKARLALIGAGLFAAAMIMMLFAFAPGLPPPALLALVPGAVMTQQLATAGVALNVTGIEWAARAFAILFHITFGSKILFSSWSTSALVSILLYLLIYSLIRIGLAWPRTGRSEAEPAYF